MGKSVGTVINISVQNFPLKEEYAMGETEMCSRKQTVKVKLSLRVRHEEHGEVELQFHAFL
jgi:hypothetical protein